MHQVSILGAKNTESVSLVKKSITFLIKYSLLIDKLPQVKFYRYFPFKELKLERTYLNFPVHSICFFFLYQQTYT